MTHLLRKALRGLGLDVTRHQDYPAEQRVRFMRATAVSLVLDVGAHTGEYATALRRAGYGGRIVSFEPLEGPFRELRQRCAQDPRWDCRRLALGERDGTVKIQVSGNVVSSSLLPMLPRHSDAAPDSRYVGDETVSMTTLDSLFDELIGARDRVALKLDVQGYEAQVLTGAPRTLSRTQIVEAELSLVPLYEGQATMCDIVEGMQADGFEIVWLERGFVDPQNGQTLQVDGIFRRIDA
jgi:FkbM family methyltransferase